jgi:hypothetical protein
MPWPATTSPTSFWSAYRQREQSFVNRAAVVKSRSPNHATITLPDDPPKQTSEGKAWGFASKTNVVFSSTVTRANGEEYHGLKMYRAGCFDEFFAELKAGKKRVGFWVDHEPDSELCSTDDGSLKVWENLSGEIRFRILPTSRNGRRAIEFIRNSSYREVSLGNTYWTVPSPDDPHSLKDIFQANIVEISLVQSGWFPDTWIDVE